MCHINLSKLLNIFECKDDKKDNYLETNIQKSSQKPLGG